MEACSHVLASLGVCLQHLTTLVTWSEPGDLFPDEKHSPAELLARAQNINQYCFYGRCLGFQVNNKIPWPPKHSRDCVCIAEVKLSGKELMNILQLLYLTICSIITTSCSSVCQNLFVMKIHYNETWILTFVTFSSATPWGSPCSLSALQWLHTVRLTTTQVVCSAKQQTLCLQVIYLSQCVLI